MVINFTRLYALLLIPLFGIFIWYTSRFMRNMYALRRKLIIILRSIIILLMVLALAGMNIKWNIDKVTTIFLIDASDSMLENREYAEEFVRKAIAEKTDKDNIGVVAFGDNALLESFISENAVFNKIETEPVGIYTNIENALTTSIALLPQTTKKRIVLITDGMENTGSSSALAPTLLNQKIDFKVVKVDKQAGNEAAIEGMSIPQRLRVGEEFNIVINIESNINTSATLTLFSGRDKAGEQVVQLQKGNNRFIFRDKALSGGIKSYRAVIEPAIDTETRNNEATAITDVLAEPKVLVLEDKSGEADGIVSILEALNIQYKKTSADGAPSSLQELAAYKTVISCNVSAENLNEGFLNSLEAYVKDLGGGFIAAGGEDSFALGGYYKTPLEKVLPVSMELKGNKEIPDMSIVLIIDKSGSMTESKGGISRLDIAKEAAARVLDSLRPKDKIGVLTFDDTTYWVVDTQKADAPEKIRDDIGTIRPGGGTSILPALEAGYKSIRESGTKIKHIILLTDGQAERTGYDELIAKMQEENITVSTVAVGQGADTQLLESIATNGKGRFYYSDEIANIPRIFAKETFMAAKAYLNNREFTPVINSSHSILTGVADQGLPALLGYVAASPKDTARVLLSSDQNDPILSIWQYGLGKTVAWNSDTTGKWSANYVTWDKNIQLWQKIINFTIEKYEEGDLLTETEVQGSKGIINVTSMTADNSSEIEATIVTPSLNSIKTKLNPTAPGQYTGSFDIEETGAYLIKLQQLNKGEVASSSNTGISVQYSPEYKIEAPSDMLERLIKEAGGVLITEPDEVFKGNIESMLGFIDLTDFLLIAALLLFVLDIALRRLNLPLERLEGLASGFVRRRNGDKKKGTAVGKKRVPAKVVKEDLLVKDEAIKKDNIVSDNKKEQKADKTLDTSALLKQKKDRDR